MLVLLVTSVSVSVFNFRIIETKISHENNKKKGTKLHMCSCSIIINNIVKDVVGRMSLLLEHQHFLFIGNHLLLLLLLLFHNFFCFS